jgi:Cu(I)/Ag(I) efflux system membrane protein CusA/SilA
MTYEKLIQEMDEKLQFPGLDMALTVIKTPVGMKIQGPSLEGIQESGAHVQQILAGLPQVRSLFAERVSQGFYLNVEVNRGLAA